MGWASDFVNAFKTGYNLVGDNDDREYKRLRNQVLKGKLAKENDPERLKLEKDVLRRRARGDGAGDAIKAEKLRYYRGLNDDAEKVRKQRDSAVPSGPAAEAPVFDPGGPRKEITDVGGSRRMSALPVGEGTDEEQLQAQDLAQDEEQDANEIEPDNDVDDQEFSCGGAVKKVRGYADGGAVDDDDDAADENDDDEDDVGAIPSSPYAPVATSQGNAPKANFSVAAARDAAREGILTAMKETGAQGEPQQGAIPHDEISGARKGSNSAYLARTGAASQDEMDAVRKAIDPQGKMTEGQRNLAALSHVYMWKLKQGDVDGANKSAAAMMQYYGHMSDRYQALAKVAAESGNVDGAIQNMLKAHANIPDGMNLRMVKRGDGSIAYTYQDEQTGKAYEQGVASPDDIVQFATKGMVNMESMLAKASGLRGGTKGAAAEKAPKAPAVRKPADRTAFDDNFDTLVGGEEGTKKLGEMAGPMKHLFGQVATDNDMPPQDALDVVRAMTNVGGDSTLKVERNQNGGAIVDVGGRQVTLSKDAYQNLVALRGRAQQAYSANEAKTKAKADAEGKRQALEIEAADAKRQSIRGMGMTQMPSAIP